MQRKIKRRLLVTAAIWVLTAVLVLLAQQLPSFFTIYSHLSRQMQRPLAAISSFVPVPLWEVLLLALILWALVSLILAIRKKRVGLWLCGLLLGVSLGVGAFVGLWGLNHFGPSIEEKLNLPVREYSVQELTEATRWFLQQANVQAALTPRKDDQTIAVPEFSELAAHAGEGYEVLRKQYDCFSGSLAKVKKLGGWQMFSRFGITGIFVCLTGESSVNPDTYGASLPFTMCHELGHRFSFAAEDEANFCAFLACISNDDPVFRYSAYYSAYIYCYNALYKISAASARKLWQEAAEGVVADSNAANRHYARYEGKVQDAAQKVNDAYLKAFQEKDGVQSYGAVTDLLLAYYFAKKA